MQIIINYDGDFPLCYGIKYITMYVINYIIHYQLMHVIFYNIGMPILVEVPCSYQFPNIDKSRKFVNLVFYILMLSIIELIVPALNLRSIYGDFFPTT